MRFAPGSSRERAGEAASSAVVRQRAGRVKHSGTGDFGESGGVNDDVTEDMWERRCDKLCACHFRRFLRADEREGAMMDIDLPEFLILAVVLAVAAYFGIHIVGRRRKQR